MYKLNLNEFLTTHEELVNKKIEELSERSPQWFEFKNSDGKYAQNLKESFKRDLQIAKFAKVIFDKYADKIFQAKTDSSPSTQELLNTKNGLANSNTSEQKSSLEEVLQSKSA